MQLLCVLALALAPAQQWEDIGPRAVSISDGAISPATESVFATRESFLFRQRSADPGPSSVLTFPGNGAARRVRLAADGGVFAASDSSLLRSDDDGDTFVDITPPLAAGTSLSAVALSPADPERVWVGAFPPSSGGPPSPPLVFTSADGGASWTTVSPPAPFPSTGVVAIGVDRADGTRAVVAFTGAPLQRTEDAGVTWSAGASLSFVDDLAVNGQNVIAAGFLAAYQSSDFGATMTESLVDGAPFFTQVTGAEFDGAGNAYVMTEFLGLYASLDGGVTLASVGGPSEEYLRGPLSLDGMDRPVIAMRDVGLIRLEGFLRSYWRGAARGPMDFALIVDEVAVPTALPDRLAALVGVGLSLDAPRTLLYTSEDAGASWTPWVQLGNAPRTAVHDGNGDLLVGTSVPAGGDTRSTLLAETSGGLQARGPVLTVPNAAAVRAIAVSPADPNHLAVAVEIDDANGVNSIVQVHSSLDRGVSWRREGSTTTERRRLDVKLAVTFDPITGDASGHLSATWGSNLGGRHEVISGPLWRATTGTWSPGVFAFGVTDFPLDPQPSLSVGGPGAPRVYVSRPSGSPATRAVLFSDDGGSNWTTASTGQPNEAYTVASPGSAATLYRFAGNRLAESFDGGVTFAEVPGDLPDLGFGAGGLRIDANETLYAFGASIYRRRDTSIGQRFCSPAALNSSGFPAFLTVTGSGSVMTDDLELDATSVPAGVFGIAIASTSTTAPMPLANSEGLLCLGAPLVRLVDSVQSSGPDGRLGRTLSLATLAAQGMTAPIAAGDTWSFQTWFRDEDAAGGPTSNLTDGVTVTFVP